MGIDAQAFSRKLPKKLFGRASGHKALRAIDRAARKWCEENDLGPFYRSALSEDNFLSCIIVPLADSIRFDLSNDGVAVGFRTSTVGPGYHAAVVEMLDRMAEELQLVWDWGSSVTSCADETGFAIVRDYDELQGEMIIFFKALMKTAADHNFDGGTLCIPYGIGLDRDEISCPLGPRPNNWPVQVLELDGTELEAAAESFFPWWEREKGTKFWERMLTGTLWQNAEWRAPVSEQEQQTVREVAYMREKVIALSGSLPSNLATAIAEYDHAIKSDEPPQADGIGYRRGFVEYNPFPGWRIHLPGYLREVEDPDGKAGIFQHGNTVFRVSSIVAKRQSGAPFKWPSILEDSKTETVGDMQWRKERMTDHGDGMSQFSILLHESADQHNLLMLTLTTETEEELSVLHRWVLKMRFRG